MTLRFRWVGEDELDQIGLLRARCYGKASEEAKDFADGVREDGRAKVGDYLLAERDGEAVGTTTSLSMSMWVRGARLPCQGIAWVGTIRTARRTSGAGVATELMIETIKKGREREQVVSALMPFRVSFYEHFGYGAVEKRFEWNVPMSILPRDDHAGVRYFEPGDADTVAACSQRQVEAGQCDIEIVPAEWANRREVAKTGFEFVDRPDRSGPANGWMTCIEQVVENKKCLRVVDIIWDSIDSLRRQLSFLADQRDQFFAAILQLPIDLPLNHLLREPQVPHRPVEHTACAARLQTRMQVRVLDHPRFFENLKLPSSVRGSATVAVRETEGNVSKFRLELADGKSRATRSDASPDIECRDVEWSSIACGALPASTAARHGLIQVNQAAALPILDVLSIGPSPFCGEYF